MADCYINLMCGGCDSQYEVNTDFEEAAWLMAYRFANAHVKCEYVLPAENVEYAFQVELPFEDQPPDVGEDDDEAAGDDGDGDGFTLVE